MTKYNDPTHLPENINPNVPAPYNVLAMNVRNKMFGEDVRESIAQSIEGAGMAVIEWQNAQQALSADSEVINARIALDGTIHSTLKAHLNSIWGKVNNLDLNKADKDELKRAIEELTFQIDTTRAGLIGIYNSEQELRTAHPKGAAGFAVVNFKENDLVVGYTYTYQKGKWTKGGPWNGLVVPRNSVGREELKGSSVNYWATNFLRLDKSINLFDGEYTNNIQLNGESGGLSLRPSEGGKTAIIPVLPNTEYSIGRKVPSRFHYGTSTRIIELNESLDGFINVNASGNGQTSSPQIVTFTTGPNDKYLYINPSLDYSEPFLKVIEGELLEYKEETYPVAFKEMYDVMSKSSFERMLFGPEKLSFMELSPNRNYFDGNFIVGYGLSGVSGTLRYSSRPNGVMVVVEVKPDTDYWLARSESDIFNFATATKILSLNEIADGNINRNMSTSVTNGKYVETTFTTGPNDRYLYVFVSGEGNRPFVKVKEGNSGTLLPVNYNIGTYSLTDMIDLNAANNAPTTAKQIEYNFNSTSKRLEIFVPSSKNGWIKYLYTLVDDSNINMYQWRVVTTSILDANKQLLYIIRADTEWEGAILEVGQPDYMGGFHGSEKNLNLNIKIDGLDLDTGVDSFGIANDSIKIVNESLLTRVDNKEVELLRRFKVSNWNLNEYSVENKYIALTDFEIKESKVTLASVDYSTNGHMLIEKGRMSDIYDTHDLSKSSNSKSRVSKDSSILEMWSNEFYLSAESIAKEYPNRSQYFQNFGQYNYAKIYFDTTGNYSIKQDEIINVKSIYKILA